MIVKQLNDVIGTVDDVDTETWCSRRLILKRDGMGYSVHDTFMKPNTATRMRYRNHLETVYCIEGAGEVETLADGMKYPILPGTLYALNQHDEHILRAFAAGLRVVCVFNPPVTGQEVHDQTGAYPAEEAAA
ncbi:MAG TPA: ectoine synthase [Gammaproteobacteria bacterium]|nr:ectoine synthase [Gammaproteobacteria bacterium]